MDEGSAGMHDTPTVAVVIPVYNCSAFIDEALESIESQTRTPDRVVVVDDGSTDGSGGKVRSFAEGSRLPIEVITQENHGIAAARNVAVARCTEEFIAFLDGDDAFYPSFLERAAGTLCRHRDLVVCFLDRDVVDEEGNFMRRDLDHPDFRAFPVARRADGTSVLEESPFIRLAAGNVIPIGLMVRRSAFEAVGGFDMAQRAVEDKPFLMRLAKLGRFGFIDEPLGIWRRHRANTSGAGNAYTMRLYDDRALESLERDADVLNLTLAELQAIRDERRLNPERLLYTASDEGRTEFFIIAQRLLKEGRTTLGPVWWGCLRYGWRRIAHSFRRKTYREVKP